jgi:hypothetical protein
VANTGLLGFNPYKTAVSLDISSRPAALANQFIQRDAAKKEAVEKYLMDYEKSINTAGMRKQEADILMNDLRDNKAYFMKNREAILNPAKYGYDAQSEYMGKFKSMQNLIAASKQAAADDKVRNEHIYQAIQQGKTIPAALFPKLDKTKLPIGQGYETVDPYDLQFDKPYNEKDFVNNVWGNVALGKEIKSTPGIDPLTGKPSKEYAIKETYSVLNPESAKIVAANALAEFDSVPGVEAHFKKLYNNPAVLKAAEEKFGEAFKYTDPATKQVVRPKIQNVEDFVAGYALTQKPTGLLEKGESELTDEAKMARTQKNRLEAARIAAATKAAGVVPSNNPPHPSNIVEAVVSGNESYGKGTGNPDFVDVTDDFAGYNVFKGKTKSGVAQAPAKTIQYYKPTNQFILISPFKDQPPEYLTPDAFKAKVIIANPDVSSSEKGWGPIKEKGKPAVNADSGYTNIKTTNVGKIGVKNGKWYNVETGKPL